MTVVTAVAARNMGRVFARRRQAVMAGAAGADNLVVVDSECWHPDIRVMAVFASIGGLNVVRRLASRFDSVVTAEAVPRDVDVIEVRRQPGDRRVAIVAIVATRYVSCVLASGSHAVVTGPAGS